MPVIYRCSKCDGETENASKLQRVTLRSHDFATNNAATVLPEDLCERCVARLKVWLRPDEKVMPAPRCVECRGRA